MLPVLIGAGVTAALGVYAGFLDRGRVATACIVLSAMLLLSVVLPALQNVLALGVAALVAFLMPNSWPLWARVLTLMGVILIALLFTISPTYLGRMLR